MKFFMSHTNNAMIFLMGAAITLTLVYVVEINQISETRTRLREYKERVGDLSLVYQEHANLLSPATVNALLVKVKEELSLRQVEEFTFLKTNQIQLSLHPKKYE